MSYQWPPRHWEEREEPEEWWFKIGCYVNMLHRRGAWDVWHLSKFYVPVVLPR